MKNDPAPSKAQLSLSQRGVVVLHSLYKACLSPLFRNSCRFYPSCSDYARDAIVRHGWVRGGILTCKRVCRCHPWHSGGEDPVPPKAQ